MIVSSTIATLLAVVGIGALLRGLGALDDASTRALGRLAVDVCFPALLFVQLSVTSVRMEDAWIVVFGAAMVSVPWLVGRRHLRPTAAFLAGLPNWVFLPLPIARAAHGDDGGRVVLLANVGAMAALWTIGVATLRGRWGGEGLLNPGFVGTVAGLVVGACGLPVPGRAVLEYLAAPTIPLALLVTGAAAAVAPRPTGEAVGVTVLRLVVWPAITACVFQALRSFGVDLDPSEVTVAVMIAAMPVAASATAFAERFDGDTRLAAQSLLLTTPASMLTVPLILSLLER